MGLMYSEGDEFEDLLRLGEKREGSMFSESLDAS